MSRKMEIGGIGATTHVDAHGERFTKEALEQMAQEIAERQQLMFWNHETTLPPIGLITKAWVEQRDDGEYQLRYEGYLFEDDDVEFLPQSEVQDLDLTWEDVKTEIGSTTSSESGHLTILYDPRNFDDKDAAPIITDISRLVTTESDHYVRKAELPAAVIWMLVGFAGGHIASGFFNKLGEVLADKTIEAGRQFYKDLASHIAHLLSKAKPEGRRPDIIWLIPIPDSETRVEGVLEEAVEKNIADALERLPFLYGAAKHIIGKNRSNYFSLMSFLYIPEQKNWDINYLVIKKSNRVIMGPRYYVPTHPLRARYEQILNEVSK